MYELQWITRKPDAEKQLFVGAGKPLRALAAGNKLASRGGVISVMMTEESEPPDERKPNQK
jgi:hypothetical protein